MLSPQTDVSLRRRERAREKESERERERDKDRDRTETQTETERRDIILLKVVFFRSLLVYLRVTFESGVEGIRLLPLDDPTNEMDNTTQVNKHEHAHTINHDVT